MKKKNKPQLLSEQIERGEWIEEESRTRGGQLIRVLIKQNLEWLTNEIDNCSPIAEPERMMQLQADKRAMRTLQDALNRWDAEGKKARQILFGRVEDWSDLSFETSQGVENGNNATSN